ncbi:MAG: penicillin acylase family protein [Halanaeroarchaeum sp.]
MPPIDRVRRAVVAGALLGTGAIGFGTEARSYLDRFAPLSGSVWRSARADRPEHVDSPYGTASVRYDDYGVPAVDADDEAALYFAVGYLHGTDRLFQMDLQRRQMLGDLSAVVGDVTLDSDEFHVKMEFARAAEATWSHLAGTHTGDLVEAYAEGVNAARGDGPLPVEFSLLEYEPDPWTPTHTMLMEKQISWGLTGSFRTLRVASVADAFGSDVAGSLFPTRLDHDTPILRGGSTERDASDPAPADYRSLVDWLGAFESDRGIGSNSWVVSGEHTESGQPIVCNDPHLTLMAPPVWYQQHLDAGTYAVRGVTFPGVPFVVIGENHAGAWGFTNVGADVLDLYEYERRDGEYRYDGEWRAIEERVEPIAVADGEDVEVTVRTTVHGPLLERAGEEVAVAWTGHAATETTEAVYEMNKSDGIDDFLAAVRAFDEPTQNVVYADGEGNTLYYVTGRIPIRTVDGEAVRGNRVFDGSAGEGEWAGFTPFERPSWEGFIPFEEKPGVVNPEYVATANQRVVDDPRHYIGQGYAPPFRGKRIYDRLDELTAAGSVTPEDMRDVQRDVVDERARMLVPRLGSVRDRLSSRARSYLAALEEWNAEMRPTSRTATVFAKWFDEYTEALYADAYEAAGLGADHYPNDWITVTLTAESPWFDVPEAPNSPERAMVDSFESVVESIAREGDVAYGSYNELTIDHPFDQSFLNYPRMPVGGSSATVKNYRKDARVGSSWRMVVPLAGDATVILPGGNDGNPFSRSYQDQLRRWAAGEYLPFDRSFREQPSVEFGGEEQ